MFLKYIDHKNILQKLLSYNRVDDAQSGNNGVERQTIQSTYRNKSIKGLSDWRPRSVSDLFAPDTIPTLWVLALPLYRLAAIPIKSDG